MAKEIQFQVNGRSVSVAAEPNRTLLTVLRDELDLMGTKYGCGEGQCGACTVFIDGDTRRSCITSIQAMEGKSVLTIEGITPEHSLNPIQKAFLQHGALQCGYCTPGMIMSAYGLLQKNSNPTQEQIISSMQGNICRCGTYNRIVAAIQQAAKTMREEAR